MRKVINVNTIISRLITLRMLGVAGFGPLDEKEGM
jgi:hypothetical protein